MIQTEAARMKMHEFAEARKRGRVSKEKRSQSQEESQR